MSYGYSNVGMDDSMRGTLAQECEPSTIPRPTGLCKRFALNVPPTQPYISPTTGVRRKLVVPEMNYQESYTDIETEVEGDFSQAEEDCRQELYSGMPPSPMPWGRRPAGPPSPNVLNMLENLIKEENEEIEKSKTYMKHADLQGFAGSLRKGFWELSSMYRNRARAGLAPMDADNLDPDVAAAMIASEEQGQVLKHIPPHALFNRLFPDDNRKCTLMVKGASKYHRDYVVPERSALLQDCLMTDVDPGIIPYGDIAVVRSDALPEALFHSGQECPDGICESKRKKHAKVSKLKPEIDDEHFELTWASPPKENVQGYQVYITPASPDKKSKNEADTKSFFVSTPRYETKWDALGSQADKFHISVSPIVGSSSVPSTPTKDMTSIDVKRPKPGTGKKHAGKVAATPKIDPNTVQAMKTAGGIEIEWVTPPGTAEGALIQYKSDAHTKMLYKVANENQVFLSIPENQGKVFISLRPRVPLHQHSEGVEIIFSMKQGVITFMQEKDLDEEDDDFKHKYNVSSLPPLSGNFIQLRGSTPPLWFPGYFSVQPGIASVMTLNEPNEALEKAWASMGPTQVRPPQGSFLLGKRWDDNPSTP